MPEVLRPIDLGQLTLIRSSHKCLNLNPIMPEVLGPDDLGQLTLIRSSYKCLNLNPIMPEVLIDNKEIICNTFLRKENSNIKHTKTIKIPQPKLLSWRPLGQQFGQAEEQLCLGLSLQDQKNFSSSPNLYPCP